MPDAVVVAAAAVVVALACACEDGEAPFACAGDEQCSITEACVDGTCVDRATLCDAAPRPAAAVHVRDADGAPLCDARVLVNGTAIASNEECAYVGGVVGDDGGDDGSVAVTVARFNFVPFSVSEPAAQQDACGVVTTTVEAVLQAQVRACTSDDDCDAAAGEACVLVKNEDRARCEARDGSANGFGCDFDNDCLHGACVDDTCTGACASDADCAVALQTCEPSAELIGGSVCVTAPFVPLPCTTSFDCAGEGGVCGGVDVVAGGLVCARPQGTAAKGDVCHEEGASDTCGTGLCDDVDDGRCTLACASDEDCAAVSAEDVQTLCTNIGVDGVEARACFAPCERESDCGGGLEGARTCRARSDDVADAVVFACDGPRGDLLLGDATDAGASCASNLSAFDANGADRFCSAPCLTDADCGPGANGVALTCNAVTLVRPSGADQSVNVCVVP